MFPFLKKDEPDKIYFLLDETKMRDRWDWGDDISFERLVARTITNEQLRDFAARFVTDEKGNFLPEEKAKKLLDRIKKAEQPQVLTQFAEAIREALVPNLKGSGLHSPSEATPDKTLPHGQQT